MELKHKAIMLSSIGFGVGIVIGVMITAFSATMEYADGNLWLCSKELINAVGNPLVAFIIQAFASGIHGAICFGGTVVYDMDEWGLLKCTVIHYIGAIGGYFILAFSMRWFSPKDMDTVIVMFSCMTVAYFIIWLINYISCKKQLKELNRELDELKASNKQEV